MAFTLTARDKKLLVGVHPDLVRVIEHAARISPFPFRITEGVRTLARQRQLVAKGASKTLNSRHLTGHAVDIVPLVDLDGDGKISSKEIYHWPLYHQLAKAIKQAARAEKVSITWGGDWRTFKDGPHWELSWKAYPAKVSTATVASARTLGPTFQPETELSARTKEGGAAGVAGLIGSTGVISPALDALTTQQSELTSGDWARVVIAGLILALSLYIVWRKLRADDRG